MVEVHGKKTKSNEHTAAKETAARHQRKHIHAEHGQTLKLGSSKAVKLFILREDKKCGRIRPEQPALVLTLPYFKQELEQKPPTRIIWDSFSAVLLRARKSPPGTRTLPKTECAREREWIQQEMWKDPRCAAKVRVTAANWWEQMDMEWLQVVVKWHRDS